MEHTDGFGGGAEVWVDGHLLKVCDYLSTREARVAPGELEGVRFAYTSIDHVPWGQAIAGNPSRKKQLDPVRKWSYTGYGKVISIMPVTIDFGLMTMEDANWSHDDKLIGKFVKVQIDRLEVSFASRDDWPEGLQPADSAGQ